MNPKLDEILELAEQRLNNSSPAGRFEQPLHVGIDLGTAYTVFVVLDAHFRPLAGRYEFTELVRDGLVVDFIGAINLLKRMKASIEAQLGTRLQTAATAYPPGVPLAEVRATRNVVIGAGLECSNFIDEPTAANALLQVRDGTIVDIGGGTTGIAILKDGEVVYTADEPTGGTHFTLVISGALDISFAEAEELKKDPAESRTLQTIIYPVMQKVGSIVSRHVTGHEVKKIYLVGGTSSMQGLADVITEMSGIPSETPSHPLFVTPIGIAMNDNGKNG